MKSVKRGSQQFKFQCFFCCCFRDETYTRLGVLVTALVEIGKEAEKENSVTANPPNESLGVVAVDEEELEGVDHNSDELHLMTQEKTNDATHI